MNNLAVCERRPAIPTTHRHTPQHITRSTRLAKRKNVAYEDDLAQRWWALPAGCLLPASDGYNYRLLFAGRRGGSTGPDVRDAVLQRSPTEQLCGNIEFHTRASDWVAHQHHSDPRYNQVILHVVLYCDTPQPTRRQDGSVVPVCSLNDLASPLLLLSQQQSQQSLWPCQHLMTTFSKQELSQRLRHAGLLRFEQKTSAFVEHIRASTPATLALSAEATQQHYTTCLLIALAEALGYGRDRDLFRAIGLYLMRQATTLPEPLGRSPAPSPLDSQRLAFFRRLMQAWQPPSSTGWQQIRTTILHKNLAELRAVFCEQGLSLARTDILICNVVLPYAAAIALIEQEGDLHVCATNLYLAHPGLSSNAITRMMCQHMGLAHEPHGACQQQGLHHIYQETCKQKHCSICIAGREQL